MLSAVILVVAAGFVSGGTAGLSGATTAPPRSLPGIERTAPGGQPGLDATNTLLIVGLGTAAYLSQGLGDDALRVAGALEDTGLDGIIDVANVYGEGYTLGVFALCLQAIGRGMSRPGVQRLGRELTSSLMLAWGVTWSLKLTIDARRPNGGSYSFPSGHTATAFAAAPVFARHLGSRTGAVAYGLAALTGVARLEERRHHVWDVLVGAAIGIVAGRLATNEGSLRVTLPPGETGVGLAIGF